MVASNAAYLHIAPATEITAGQANWLQGQWSSEELKRWQSLQRDSAKQRFLTSRYWLFYWLQTHWGVERPRFISNAHGKPFLQPAALEFSFSHSHDWIVLAVAATPIGVDIERIERLKPKHLAWFSPAEQSAFEQHLVTLAELWTIKEAIVKQKGSTLAQELSRTSINWLNWRGSHELYSQVWHNDWQLSAYAPNVTNWYVLPEVSESVTKS